MNTLGIRVTPSEIYYSIYNSELKKIEIKVFKRAKYLDIPQYLKYVRYNFLDTLSCKKIEMVVIIKIEPTSDNISFDRIYTEGVLQEALASSDTINYLTETKTTSINQLKKINPTIKGIKEINLLLKNKENFNSLFKDFINIDTIEISNNESREAILASVLAYNKRIICLKK